MFVKGHKLAIKTAISIRPPTFYTTRTLKHLLDATGAAMHLPYKGLVHFSVSFQCLGADTDPKGGCTALQGNTSLSHATSTNHIVHGKWCR